MNSQNPVEFWCRDCQSSFWAKPLVGVWSWLSKPRKCPRCKGKNTYEAYKSQEGD